MCQASVRGARCRTSRRSHRPWPSRGSTSASSVPTIVSPRRSGCRHRDSGRPAQGQVRREERGTVTVGSFEQPMSCTATTGAPGLFARVAARIVGSRPVHTLHGVPDRSSPWLAVWTRPRRPVRRAFASRGSASVLCASRRCSPIWEPWSSPRMHSRAFSPSTASRVAACTLFPTVCPFAAWSQGCCTILRGWGPPRSSSSGRGSTSSSTHGRRCSDRRNDVFGDGSLRRQLEEQASRLGISVRFHGLVDDLRDRLLELDVFVLATRAENLPVAILEAMAIGLPVVATRVGGIPLRRRRGDRVSRRPRRSRCARARARRGDLRPCASQADGRSGSRSRRRPLRTPSRGRPHGASVRAGRRRAELTRAHPSRDSGAADGRRRSALVDRSSRAARPGAAGHDGAGGSVAGPLAEPRSTCTRHSP